MRKLINWGPWSDPAIIDAEIDDAMAEAVLGPVLLPMIPVTLLNRSAGAVERILEDAKATRDRLLKEIEDRQEQLRQTDVVIAVFEPALKGLENGVDAPAQKRRGKIEAVA